MSYTVCLSPGVRRALVNGHANGRVRDRRTVIGSLVRRGLAVETGPTSATLTEAGRREADALAGRVSR